MGKRTYEPDWKGGTSPGTPKPAKETKRHKQERRGKGRIVDRAAVSSKLASDQTCRATGRRAAEGHHILLKSQGGDDSPDNILPLCKQAHDTYHRTGSLPGVNLTDGEYAYLVGALGEEAAASYIQRKFPIPGKLTEQSLGEGVVMANKQNSLPETDEAKLEAVTEAEFGAQTKLARAYGRKALKVNAGLRDTKPTLGDLSGEQADRVLELLGLPARPTRARETAAV